MKGFVALAFILAVPALAAVATAGGSSAVVICHRTTSDERPYVRLTVPPRRLHAHSRHAADVIPAPRACPASILTPFHGGRDLDAPLVGDQTGDPIATGVASVRLRSGQGQVCAVVNVDDLSYLPTVGVHLHRIGGDAPSATVVHFRGLGPNDRATSSCVRVPRRVVSQILRSPSTFEVDVHTPDFQSGAVRGRLGQPVPPPPRALATQLTGGAVCTPTCAAGDADGFGFVYVRITPPADVCFRLHLSPTVARDALSAHLHRGAAGTPGPQVAELAAPVDGRSIGCSTVDDATYDEIRRSLASFYVDVHNAEFPAGAVRGQLPAT